MTQSQFKALFEKHFDGVRNYLYYRSGDAELATDLAQDTFIKIWEKQLSPDSRGMSGLLYKVAGNLFVSSYRKQVVARKFMLEFKDNEDDRDPEKLMEFEEMKQHYELALAKLNDKQRTVFLMSRMDGLKYREIADRLSISAKAVEKRMTQALASLRKALDQS